MEVWLEKEKVIKKKVEKQNNGKNVSQHMKAKRKQI